MRDARALSPTFICESRWYHGKFEIRNLKFEIRNLFVLGELRLSKDFFVKKSIYINREFYSLKFFGAALSSGMVAERKRKMQIYEELVARGLIAQVTNEDEIKEMKYENLF